MLSSTCLFSAGKPFPFQVHNIYTYPCQPPPLTGVCINIMDLDVTWLSGINSVLNR